MEEIKESCHFMKFVSLVQNLGDKVRYQRRDETYRAWL